MKVKKGQFWYSDFLIGLFILIIISAIFVITIVDINSREDTLQSLIDDGVTISNSLMSEGYLKDEWVNNKGRIGFVKNGKVDNNNLASFDTISSYSISPDNYKISKYLLGTINDYAVYFEDKDGDVVKDKVYGKVNTKEALDDLGVENLVRFTRFVYYDYDDTSEGIGEIVKMILVVWEPL